MTCDEKYFGSGWGDLPYGSPDDSDVLGIESAIATKENCIEVTFSKSIYYSGLLDIKDASDYTKWSVSVIESIGYNGQPARNVSPIKIERVSDTILNVITDRTFTPYPAKYSVTCSDIWTVNQVDLIDDCFVSYGFYGVMKTIQSNEMDLLIPARDIASPQTRDAFADPLPFVDPSLLGVVNIDDSGDYAFDEGITALQKRITRRLITTKNGFRHLIGYGIGIGDYSKKLSRAIDRHKIAQDISQQIKKEPEVKNAECLFSTYKNKPNLIKLTLKIDTTLGYSFTVQKGFEIGLTMADLPTRIDLQNVGAAFVVENAKRIDPNQVYVEGSDINIFVGSTAVMGHSLVNQMAYKYSTCFLDSNFGEGLDRYALDRYQENRKPASVARTEVQFVRKTFDGGAGDIEIGTIIKTKTGIEFITTTLATFGASDLKSSAKVRSVQAGSNNKVGKNTLVQFGQPGAIFDQTITVNNEEASAGGEDEEDDDTFKARLRNFFVTARRGTLPAIEQGGIQTLGVVSARAEEVLTNNAEPARIVRLYIADGSGIASKALAYETLITLNDWRAAGIGVVVETSIPQMITVKLTLVFRANVDTDSLSYNIRSAILTYINNLPVNGALTISGLSAILERFKEAGLKVELSSIDEPVATIVPDPGYCLRTTLASIVLS